MANYNPNQARDKNGMWTDGSPSAASVNRARTNLSIGRQLATSIKYPERGEDVQLKKSLGGRRALVLGAAKGEVGIKTIDGEKRVLPGDFRRDKDVIKKIASVVKGSAKPPAKPMPRLFKGGDGDPKKWNLPGSETFPKAIPSRLPKGLTDTSAEDRKIKAVEERLASSASKSKVGYSNKAALRAKQLNAELKRGEPVFNRNSIISYTVKKNSEKYKILTAKPAAKVHPIDANHKDYVKRAVQKAIGASKPAAKVFKGLKFESGKTMYNAATTKMLKGTVKAQNELRSAYQKAASILGPASKQAVNLAKDQPGIAKRFVAKNRIGDITIVKPKVSKPKATTVSAPNKNKIYNASTGKFGPTKAPKKSGSSSRRK